MSPEQAAADEILALRRELALLRGEVEPQPSRILEGPAEVLELARQRTAPEDALLPKLDPSKTDLSLDDGYVVQRMIEVLQQVLPLRDGGEGARYARARGLALELLALRLGPAKLLWMRREVQDIFRRSGQILEHEVRRKVEGS